jgi:hypothetical protein
MGTNLAIGIALAFAFVFLIKSLEYGREISIPPMLAFGCPILPLEF